MLRYQHKSNMKKIIFYTIFISLFGCHGANTKLSCSNENTTEITFLKDSIRINIPRTWIKNDTANFHNDAIVYHNNIMSDDTSCFALIVVSDYSIYKDVTLNASAFFNKMRAKMGELNNGKDSLVEDVTKRIKGHEVNFLKYMQTGITNKVYNAHIGFMLPEKKQIEIQLRLTEAKGGDVQKTLECIFESLQIK